MNRKINKKVLAIILVMTLVFPVLIFADLQSPVTDLSITNRSDKNGTGYSVELRWERPESSNKQDIAALSPDDINPHRATEYRLYFRNATLGESYTETNRINIDDTYSKDDPADNTLTYLFNETMQDGSIYSFVVDPNHQHNYETVINGSTGVIVDDANHTNVPPKEVLFLTDLNVSAEITGNEMTVTWDNPTFMGSEVFTGYKIYYQKGGSTIDTIPENPNVIVDANDEDLKRVGNSLEYTFEAENLEVGQVYAVKVEPMYNGLVLREMSAPKVTINDVSYDISFTQREYRTNDTYVHPSLYIMQEGLDNVRLYWDSLKSSTLDITKLEIYSAKTESFEQSVLIGSLEGDSAKNINYWLTPIPDSLTFYKFIIYYKDGTKINTMDSNIVYFDPTIFDFDPYMPNIMQVDATTLMGSPSLKIYWEAFLRDPYTEEEEILVNTDVDKFVDKDLDYKIWITDDIRNYSVPAFENSYIEILDATTLSEESLIIDEVTEEKTLVYSDIFKEYYEYDDGATIKKPLEENRIYYIKIQAQRHLSGDLSQPAYYAIYIPPTTPIITNPLTLNKPPFKIKVNEKGVEEITETTITVEWSTEWFEIFDIETEQWYSAVGVNDSGEILFGSELKDLPRSQILYLDSDIIFGTTIEDSVRNIKKILVTMGANETAVSLLPIRYMDISNSQFELHTAPYTYMEEQGGYSTYFDIIKEEESLWTGVNGTPNGDRKLEYVVTAENAPTTSGLLPNTSYIIYFRNYIEVDGERIYSEHPIYATGTTLSDRDDIIVDPPAQILELVTTSYDSVTVRWQYTEGIEYELRYSDLLTDYSEGGESIDHQTIIDNMKMKTEDGVNYIYLTIPNLFPNTVYYVWLKGISGGKESEWSTVVDGKTLDLLAPQKPRGVGLISDEMLNVINSENGKSYVKDAQDYLMFEWTRVAQDTKDYGVKGITAVDKDEYFGTPTYDRSYGVKFNDLKPNSRYYFRVRTILNAVRVGMGGEYHFSYEVELADNPRFKDSTKFFVPDLGYEVDGVDILESKSEWSTTYSFETGRGDGEYDGDIDPDQYPLPLDDFDVTYDESTDTLKYVFRSTGLDSDGNQNHYVDQRFITSLQQRGYYDFVVDVTDYEGIYPKTRIVEVPSSIVNALMDTKTSLTMVADNMEVTITPASLQSEKAFEDPSGRIVFEYNLNEGIYNGLLGPNENYISTPHNFKAMIYTDDIIKDVNMFSNDVEVRLKPRNQYEAFDKNVNVYKLNGQQWEMQPSTLLSTGEYEVTTKAPSTYTLIAKEGAVQTQEIDDSLYNVMNELYITDMGYYEPYADVSTTQFNNIIYAVAMGDGEVAMNEGLTQDKFNELGKSGLLVSGRYVSYNDGVESLTRLYEIKTGQRADDLYIPSKSGNLKFGDFIDILDIILADS